MKVLVTADLHFDLKSHAPAREYDDLLVQICMQKPDILIIAGDTVGLGKGQLGEILSRFSDLKARKLIVPGNHDIWLTEGNSATYYLETLPELYARYGFHMLDRSPVVIADVGFAGSMLWYDYSLRDPQLRLPPGSSYDEKRWKGRIIWNDANFALLPWSDPEFCQKLLHKLAADIQQLKRQTDFIIVTTHHVGCREMVLRREKPEWNFANAFMGTAKLEQLLLSHPEVKYHFCAHTHARRICQKQHLHIVNVGCTYQKKRFDLLSIQRDEQGRLHCQLLST
jgi:predicted phosphodiesterase